MWVLSLAVALTTSGAQGGSVPLTDQHGEHSLYRVPQELPSGFPHSDHAWSQDGEMQKRISVPTWPTFSVLTVIVSMAAVVFIISLCAGNIKKYERFNPEVQFRRLSVGRASPCVLPVEAQMPSESGQRSAATKASAIQQQLLTLQLPNEIKCLLRPEEASSIDAAARLLQKQIDTVRKLEVQLEDLKSTSLQDLLEDKMLGNLVGAGKMSDVERRMREEGLVFRLGVEQTKLSALGWSHQQEGRALLLRARGEGSGRILPPAAWRAFAARDAVLLGGRRVDVAPSVADQQLITRLVDYTTWKASIFCTMPKSTSYPYVSKLHSDIVDLQQQVANFAGVGSLRVGSLLIKLCQAQSSLESLHSNLSTSPVSHTPIRRSIFHKILSSTGHSSSPSTQIEPASLGDGRTAHEQGRSVTPRPASVKSPETDARQSRDRAPYASPGPFPFLPRFDATWRPQRSYILGAVGSASSSKRGRLPGRRQRLPLRPTERLTSQLPTIEESPYE